MGDQNLRVWEVDGDAYSDVKEFPRYAKHRFEPQTPGATGPYNTDLVVFAKGAADKDEEELARFQLDTVLIALPGQPTPDAVLASERDRRTTETATTASRPKTKAGSAVDKK